jgi:pyruvyltransferase
MYWWRFDSQPKRNFGDEISPLLVDEIFGRRCMWVLPHQCEVVAAGSIIELMMEMKGHNRPVLWGTGFMREEDDHLSEHDFDVVAVRGARSRDRMDHNRDRVALGDPGLLASTLLSGTSVKRHRVGLLPHFLDARVDLVDWLREQPGVHLIDATDDPRKVIEEIAGCETLLSSSLHGLIVADSVGTPNAHLRLSNNRFIGGMYKFRDYYSAFADPARYFAISPDRVMAQGIDAVATRIEERYRVPLDLPRLKEDLIKSFPFA